MPNPRLEPLGAPEHAPILSSVDEYLTHRCIEHMFRVMHRRSQGRGSRSRRRVGPDEWAVRARVERFHEPVLLLLLRERPRHGYELIELVPELSGGDRIDVGNLYRFLRALESEGIVESEWDGDLPGPAKRTYRLTDAGVAVLGQWADALGRSREEISAFLDRYQKGGE
jgi:PadR family transcriptional regulator PadR